MPDPLSDPDFMFHATTVCVDGRALVMRGPSGSGKSSLALQMIALGAQLVADDQTCLRVRGGCLFASAPNRLLGGIEARGIGLLSAPAVGEAKVQAILDMEYEETHRLPAEKQETVFGVAVPVFHKCGGPHAAAGYVMWLRNGWFEGGAQT